MHGVLGGIAGAVTVYYALPNNGKSKMERLSDFIIIGIALFVLGVIIGDMVIVLAARGIVSIISAF